MKIEVGYWVRDGKGADRVDVYGTIEDTPAGLKYTGDEQKLRDLVDMVVSPEKPENAPGGLVGFLHWFARQMDNGYSWCRVVKDKQPAHS